MISRLPSPVVRVVSMIVWLLPASTGKNRLLRSLGHTVGDDVRIGPTVVLGGGRFEFGDRSSVGSFNVFRNLRRVELGSDAFIGGYNQMTAAPEYRDVDALAGTLVLANRAGIINRHYLDCSGRIEVGEMSMIGGIKSVLQTHELDLASDTTTIGTIKIGEFAFTGTGVILLQGAVIPDRSVLAAGSTRLRSAESDLPDSLYAGSPARRIKDISDWKWPRRTEIHTPVDERTRIGGR